MFKSKKRKILNTDSSKNNIGKVIPISLEAAVLIDKTKQRTLYFKRLNYKFCPPLIKKDAIESAINMHREDLVLEIYEALKDVLEQGRNTISAIFDNIATYISDLDKVNRKVDFSEDNVLWYFDLLRKRCQKGEIKEVTFISKILALKKVLLFKNDLKTIRKIPTIKTATKTIKTTPLGDIELKKIQKKLTNSFKKISTDILNDGFATQSYLIDIQEENLLSKEELKHLKKKESSNFYNKSKGFNFISSLAFMIVSMWTGANYSPLAKMTKRDVILKKGNGDSYIFNTVKGRAGYARQDLGFGFNKHTKEFIEKWLLISEMITPNDPDAFLFPYIARNGKVIGFTKKPANPHKKINDYFKLINYPLINTSLFRATRSSIVFRAYNDVLIVADANKHTPQTAAKSYLHGNPDAHNMQLASAFEAQNLMATGVEKEVALNNSFYKFKDPFTNDEWIKKKNKLPNKTPTGIRCTDPFGDKAKKTLRAFREINVDQASACIDFLSCFQCENHALIAEKDDIWLMLSFKDTIHEAMARPSFNSIPSDNLNKILNTVNQILDSFKIKAPKEYQLAYERNNDEPHPLYNDEESINDLLDIYK